MESIKQFGGNMNKFNVGDLVLQKDDFYSFLCNNSVYVVTANCDGFMYLEGVYVPVFSLDFNLYKVEKT